MASFVRCARMATQVGSQFFRKTTVAPTLQHQTLRNFVTGALRLSDRKYTEGHEWITMDGDVGTVGLSEHAQDSLGDIVFVELPDVDNTYDQDDDCGVVESVKAVSEIFCPVSGKIVGRNEAVVEDPSLINKSYYDKGWLFKIELSKKDELDELMDEDAYKAFLESQ